MCRLFLRSFRSGSPACNGIQPRSCIPHLNVGSSHRRLEVQEADGYCEHDFTFQSDSAAVLEALSRGTERFSRFALLATQRQNDSEKSPMQSVPSEKGIAVGIHALTATLRVLQRLPSMDVETCLPEHAERTYGAVCLHGRVLSFAIEKPCRCCHFTRRAELTVSSGTAWPSVQTDSSLPAVETCPCNGPPAIGKQERCPPP